jgi:GntR family transcriptional repressor for pyruvate dehydrogenase complex
VAHGRLEPVVDAVAAGDESSARRAAERYLTATERIMLEALA